MMLTSSSCVCLEAVVGRLINVLWLYAGQCVFWLFNVHSCFLQYLQMCLSGSI